MLNSQARNKGAVLLLLAGIVLSACDTGGTTAQPTAITEPTATQAGALPTDTPAEATPTEATQATATTAGVSGKIDFQVFGDPAEYAVFKQVGAAYEQSHPGTSINVINVPKQGDHMTKLSTAFAAGNPPDVFLINYRRYGQFASKGVIEPAGPLLAKSATLKEEQYAPEALDAFRYKGTLMCIPQNVSSLAVYYNKDLFEKAKVPLPTADWTWSDFLNAAQNLTQDTNGDGKTDIYGVGVEPQIIRLAPFVWQNGGEIVDNSEKPTTLTLSDGPALQAVRFFVSLRREHKVVPSEAESKAEDDEARFMNGRLGMVLQSRAATPSFREIKGFQWDVAPLPKQQQKATILHSDAYCIAAPSKNKELAWSFVEWAQGTEGQTLAAKLGRTVPSLKSVAQSPAFLDPAQPPANSKIWLDAVPSIKRVPVLSTWPKIESTVNEELERAFYGDITVEQALAKATEDTKALFAQGDADK